MLEERSAEVDEQTDPEIEDLEIGEHLFEVYRCELLHRSQFNDHTSFYEQVETKSLVEHHPILGEHNDLLSLYLKSTALEPRFQQRLVHDDPGQFLVVLHFHPYFSVSPCETYPLSVSLTAVPLPTALSMTSSAPMLFARSGMVRVP